MSGKGLVIGAGPAGLLAAWAFESAKWEVTIVDRDVAYYPDRIFSLQYLHDPCGLSVQAVRSLEVEYVVCGDDHAITASENEEQYREAVAQLYNAKLNRPLTDENSTRFLWNTPVRVWSLKDAYRSLHQTFKDRMLTYQVSWERIVEKCYDYDVVVSTAPINKFFPTREWPVRTGWIALDWVPSPLDREDEVCLYNIDPEIPWYRATVLDGGKATEFTNWAPEASAWREEHGVPALQPLRKVAPGATLPSLPPNLLLTGRWGSWDPVKLTHSAYLDVKEFIER